jgi:flagellar motor switch protein FliN/FliY
MPGSLFNRPKQMSAASNSIAANGEMVVGIEPLMLPDFASHSADANAPTAASIPNTDLGLRIEFGRTHISREDELKLSKGSVVPLDKMASDPADVFVNGRLIARGEVVVFDENLCVRIAEIIVPKTA